MRADTISRRELLGLSLIAGAGVLAPQAAARLGATGATDLLGMAKAISSSSPAIRAYAVEQANEFLTLQKDVATLKQLVAQQAAPSGPVLDARKYGFQPWVNGANANKWWDNLLGDVAGTPESLTIQLPPGHFMTTEFKDWSVADLHFIGSGGNPAQLNSTPNPRAKTTLSWGGLPGIAGWFGQDGGSYILKPGVVCEYIDFYNTLRDWSCDAFHGNNVNDGAFEHCGAKFLRSLLYATDAGGTGDNAHWWLSDNFMYSCDYLVYADGIFGINVEGGEWTGDGSRKQVGVWLGQNGAEANISKVKGVGLRGGFAVVNGGYTVIDDCDAEKCGDETHPVVDLQGFPARFPGDRSGIFNRITETCTFTGSGVELPTRMGPNSGYCSAKAVHDNMGAHPGLRVDEVLDLGQFNTVDDGYTLKVRGKVLATL